MESEDGEVKNNFTNLAPRPWKSFKSEQTEAMVVQKRSRISLHTQVNLEGGNTANERVEEGEKVVKEELRGDGAEGKERKEDEADDAGVYRNLIKEQKNGLNPFDSEEEEDQVIERKVGVRASKKRKAPQPPVKLSSSPSNNIQEDVTERVTGKLIFLPVVTSSNSEEAESEKVENTKGEICLEKTLTTKEVGSIC